MNVNIDLAPTIIFLHQLKLIKYDENLATLLKYLVTLFGFEVRKCFHWIPCPRKCGFNIKNHIYTE